MPLIEDKLKTCPGPSLSRRLGLSNVSKPGLANFGKENRDKHDESSVSELRSA